MNNDEFSSHAPSPTVQLAKRAIDALEDDAPLPVLNEHVRAWQAYIGKLGGAANKGHRWTSKAARAANRRAVEARWPVRMWEVRVGLPAEHEVEHVQARSQKQAIMAYAKAHGLPRSTTRLSLLAKQVGGWCEVVCVEGGK